MQICNLRVKLAQVGNDVPVEGVTPAEAVILTHAKKGLPSHSTNAGGFPLSSVSEVREAKELVFTEDQVWQEKKDGKARTNVQELARLRRKYSAASVDSAFPGASPVLPEKFDIVQGWKNEDLKVLSIEGQVAQKSIDEEEKEATEPVKPVVIAPVTLVTPPAGVRR